VGEDGWIFQTAKLDFEFKHDDAYMELTRKNEGKYEIDDKGFIVLKGGGEKGMVLGMPFPTVDPKDPKAAEKIMENHHFMFYRRVARLDLRLLSG